MLGVFTDLVYLHLLWMVTARGQHRASPAAMLGVVRKWTKEKRLPYPDEYASILEKHYQAPGAVRRGE